LELSTAVNRYKQSKENTFIFYRLRKSLLCWSGISKLSCIVAMKRFFWHIQTEFLNWSVMPVCITGGA